MHDIAEKKCVQESNDFIVQAQTCLLTAARAFDRRRCFTTSNIFSLLHSSIEKYFMGFFLCNDHRPAVSSISELVKSFKHYHPLDEELEKDLIEIDLRRSHFTANSCCESSQESDYIERLFDTAQKVSQLVMRRIECE